MLLVARAVAQTSPAGRRRDAFFLSAGLALGLAATFRIHTLAMAGVVVLAVLWVRQWRGALLIGSGLILGLGPQFWYNATVSGHPLNMPYISEWLGFDSQGQFYFSRTTMHFSPQFLLDSLTLLARGNPALAVVGAATGVAAVYLFIHCWRRCGSFAAIVMFGAPLASLGLHVITYVFIIDPIRFALPALSMGIPAGVWSLFFAASTLQTKIVSLRSVPGAKGTL
jgi:hypothetical protein